MFARLDLRIAMLAALALSACATKATKPPPDEQPQIIDASVTLPPGAVLEGSWDGGPEDELSFVLAMDNPVLDWDIHTHDDGGTQTYIVEEAVANASYTLDPTHDTTWYVLVKNSGATTESLDAELALTPGTTWSGW
jgi:hypothetical protein